MKFQNFKKYYFYFISTVIFGILFIVTLILYTKAYKNEKIMNSIYKKNHHAILSDRVTRFYILNNAKKLDHIIMGSSSGWVLNPKMIEDSYQSDGAINISLGGGSVNEHHKFILWILENKKEVKEIMLNLEPNTFHNKVYSRLPYELEISLKDKVGNFFSFITVKDAIKILLTKFGLLPKKTFPIEKNTNDSYFYYGFRHYPEYFQRLKNDKMMKKMVNDLKNGAYQIYQDKEYNKLAFKNLAKILKITKKKNIQVKLFFDPVTYRKLKSNNYEYLYSELKIIKKIVNDFNHDVLFFNNLNKINYSLDLFEDGHDHYNYDAGKIVLEEILKDELKIGIKISKNNFNDVLYTLIKKIEKRTKLDALH